MNRHWQMKAWVVALGLLASVGVWTVMNRNVQSGAASYAAPRSKALPALQGQPAVDYLKQHGLFDHLKASIEASRHEIQGAARTALADVDGSHRA
ncbi:MAG: hypothetical protein M3X11_04665, partial [Acidobacteriota bacterium]|nr:hypothetical protein [Acidobacteriota bacterium]